jgi:hypothetical protein
MMQTRCRVRQITSGVARIVVEKLCKSPLPFVVCLILISSLSPGQSKVAPSVPLYAEAPFNPRVDRLPPHYVGHDADRIFALMEKREKFKTKGEFETTKQYESRIESQKQQPLYGSLRFDSLFAFRIAMLTFHYDADATHMKLYAPTEFAVDNADQIDHSRIGIKVKESTSFRSYPASNAFGATTLVKETDVKSTQIGALNASDFELRNDADPDLGCFYGPDLQCFYGELHLAAEQARRVKQSAKALVIGSLADPPVSKGSSVGDATISNPTAYFGQIHYVNVQISEIWVYSPETGTIFLKIRPTTDAR